MTSYTYTKLDIDALTDGIRTLIISLREQKEAMNLIV